ncbi:phosphotransferase [Tepidibacillus fermentans]|uniref:CotS family spore coat protein n=1 Tax=Tepidibacillus fermentans TaxID=1281767 RepID=A0A4R3K7J0_9BACI|nr:phosphotransferase [Tepidibacillus fermentans]TCS78768.1 CotS family spore coat protein [Tepidibacillus fermentans]
MEERISESLAREYGIEIERIERFRHLWKVYAKKGVYVVKAFPNAVSLVYWQTYLFNELRKKGFSQFSQILRGQHGYPWFGVKSYPLVVMPYLEGETARYSKLDHLEKVVRVLANFHHHAAWIGTEVKPKYRELRTYRLFRRLQEFEQLYQNLMVKKERDALDDEILIIGQEMIDFGKETFQYIDQYKINRINQDAIDYRFVAHRDVANHNFLLGEKVWMIDFDLSGYEAQVMDLWQLINRVMVDWNWDLDIFLKVEEDYSYYRKLTDDERMILRQLSLYPNEFFRESLGAYYRPNKYKKDHVLPYIQRFRLKFDCYYSFREKILRA